MPMKEGKPTCINHDVSLVRLDGHYLLLKGTEDPADVDPEVSQALRIYKCGKCGYIECYAHTLLG